MKNMLEETMKCVRCGACKAFCPTYIEGLSEAISPRGRVILIRNLIDKRLESSDALIDDIYSCLLCEACKGECPLRIDISSIIYEGRKILAKDDKRGRYLRWLVRLFSRYPSYGFRISKSILAVLSPYLYKKEIVPFRLDLPESPLRDEYHVLRPHKRKGRVAIFTGCSTNYLFPHLGLSLINVLLNLGYEVILPKGEVCCGAPLRELGLENDAVRMAVRNIDTFGKLHVEAVLTLCPTCLLSIRHQYKQIAGGTIHKAMDISEFLLERLFDIESRGPEGMTVSYHDPCHHIHSTGIAKEPREIMNRLGLNIVEMDEKGCCGFAGFFSFRHRGLSRALLRKKTDSFRRTGAEALVTACPGCIMQLRTGIKDIPTYHIIEVIELFMRRPAI